MAERDDDRFRPKLGRPRSRDGVATQRFISRVVKATNQAGAVTSRRLGGSQRGLSQFHRGAAVASTLKPSGGVRDRRVLIKSLLVNLKRAAPDSTQTHLKYLGREGVTKDGSPTAAYGPEEDQVDVDAFEARGRHDRHHFRFIVSPEDVVDLQDLRDFTRELMKQMQKDLGTRLEWVAVDHWDTDNPHSHIVLRGKDQYGRDLIIAREYLSHGMRARAAEIATEWLGPRTEREIKQTLQREVGQERWTSLDITIQRNAVNGEIDVRGNAATARNGTQRALLIGRLQKLRQLGLASERRPGVWSVDDRSEPVLRAAGERGDIIRTMQRAVKGLQRPVEIFDATVPGRRVVGRLLEKGLVDEMSERTYVIIDGVDGRAHYVRLARQLDDKTLTVGAIVEVRGVRSRASDKEILGHVHGGIYEPERHLASAKLAGRTEQDAREYVTAHVRRLEALRRAGIVERLSDGRWRVPNDLPQRGQAYDVQRSAGADVRIVSTLSIGQQARAIGATWLDQQLVGDPAQLVDGGFGREVRAGLRARLSFLTEQGLAEHRDGKVALRGNHLATLRDRELSQVGQSLATKLGLLYKPVADGQRVAGTYRQSLSLVSGRFALLESGGAFSLVPWRPVVEKRLGQSVTAVVRGMAVSWDFRERRGLGL